MFKLFSCSIKLNTYNNGTYSKPCQEEDIILDTVDEQGRLVVPNSDAWPPNPAFNKNATRYFGRRKRTERSYGIGLPSAHRALRFPARINPAAALYPFT